MVVFTADPLTTTVTTTSTTRTTSKSESHSADYTSSSTLAGNGDTGIHRTITKNTNLLF